MTPKPSTPTSIREMLIDYRAKIADVIQQQYGHDRPITTEALVAIDDHAAAHLERIVLEGRIAELENLINAMNAGDELLQEPTAANKPWNVVIMHRIADLRRQMDKEGEK